MAAHGRLVERARRGGIDLYCTGDSIVRRWGADDHPRLKAHWDETFRGYRTANFGCGANHLQNILWRLLNGELDGVNPRLVVLLAGTNNAGEAPRTGETADDILRCFEAVLKTIREKAPGAVTVLTAIFPRTDAPEAMPIIFAVNARLPGLCDGQKARFLDVNAGMLDGKGRVLEGMLLDGLHPGIPGYRVWAAGLMPIVREVLGKPRLSGPD